MRLALIVGAVIAVFAASSFLAVYSYGHFAQRSKGKPSTALPVQEGRTVLDRTVSGLTGGGSGEHGLMLLPDNLDAFALRALSARAAGRSLDLMYYIWHGDLTGKLLAHDLLQAAERGVRVRLLLDDMTVFGSDAVFAAVDAHENIAVRLFNPGRARGGALRRGLEMLLRAFSSTRRMHNKAWIADGRLAIVGGRNVGDEYFDAAQQSNFLDMDVLMVGPGVKETETVFDSFWNSDVVLPISALAAGGPGRIQRLREDLAATAAGSRAKPYIDRIRERVSVAAMTSGEQGTLPLHWTPEAAIVSDPPAKALGESEENWLMRTLLPAIESGRRSVDIISPYFIPGVAGTAHLTGLVAKGVDVAILTNSLAATDVVAVHGAYARYRQPLLEGGVQLFELQPFASRPDPSAFGSSGASLHTKAFTVDGSAGFVGSFNFDPRSVSLNTEMGLFFRDAGLATEIGTVFERQTSPQAAYRVMLEAGELEWRGEEDGSIKSFGREPEAGILRVLFATIVGLLPIESQL